MSLNMSSFGFNYLQDGEKWRIYLKPFSCDPPTSHKDGHTDSHTHGQADDSSWRENATRCISPNNCYRNIFT